MTVASDRITRSDTTDETGGFVFEGIEPGEHMVTIDLAGFQSIRTTAAVVPGQSLVLGPLTLAVAGVSEQVEVDSYGQTRDLFHPIFVVIDQDAARYLGHARYRLARGAQRSPPASISIDSG